MSDKFYCFGDFEFTCGGKIVRDTCELLSVGIIICDGSYKIRESFYCTARPLVNPKMTKQCVKLTKLGQQDIYNSPDSNSVLLIVRELMVKYDCRKLYVWGNFDRPGLMSDCGMHRRLRRDASNIRAVADSIEDVQKELVGRLGLPEAINIAELSSVFGFVPRNGTYHNALNDAMGLYEIHRGAYATDHSRNPKLRALIDERIARREEKKRKAAERRREIALSIPLSSEECRYLDSFGDEREAVMERLLQSRYYIVNYMRNRPDEEFYEMVVFDSPKRFKIVAGSVYTIDKSQSAIMSRRLTKENFGKALVKYMRICEEEELLI